MTTMFEPVTTPIPRDRYGRPLVTPPDGGKPTPYRRVTTFVDVLDDKYNLQKWMQRMVVVGLATRPDLALAASTAANDPDSNKRDLDRICDEAREAAAASGKATIGTALHALTERIDRGEPVGVVPDNYLAHLTNYEAATRALTAVHIEQMMVHDDLQIAGTPDRIVTVDGMDGCFIADVKTGPSTMKFGVGKVAMQMSAYAHSLLYNHETNTRVTVPGLSTTAGIVIELNSDTGSCELHWIDLEAGWRGVQVAREVWGYRGLKELTKPFRPVVLPDPVSNHSTKIELTETSLETLIRTATSVQELTALWDANQDRWTDHLTGVASIRKAELEAQQ